MPGKLKLRDIATGVHETKIGSSAGAIWEPPFSNSCLYKVVNLSQEVFVTVRVEESGYFRREGVHVHTDADISLSQAILGGVIRIQVTTRSIVYSGHRGSFDIVPLCSPHKQTQYIVPTF